MNRKETPEGPFRTLVVLGESTVEGGGAVVRCQRALGGYLVEAAGTGAREANQLSQCRDWRQRDFAKQPGMKDQREHLRRKLHY